MVNLFQSNVCAVCMEQYTDGKFPVGLPCGHLFCCQCVKHILDAVGLNICPIDRQLFSVSHVQRIYNNGEEETPREKLQNVTEYLTQLERKNSELESRNQHLERLLSTLTSQHEHLEMTFDEKLEHEREANEQARETLQGMVYFPENLKYR